MGKRDGEGGRAGGGNEIGALSVLVQRNSREINGSSSCPSECSIHRSRTRSTGSVNPTNPTPGFPPQPDHISVSPP